MPIPKPKPGETKKIFIGKCMFDGVMINEYKDTDQRYAICIDSWEKNQK